MRLKGTGPILLIVAFFTGVYVFWGDGRPTSETFRYKLTINVTVDGKPYSASSVIEARQEVNSCRSWVGSTSRKCLPLFSAKGVAPMIMLPDGAVIFASLSGNSSDKPPGVKGTAVARLPWLIYVPDWREVADTSGKNWSIVPLPKETPRLKIAFAGDILSKFKPVIWWVPPQQLGPPKGYRIGPVHQQNATSGRVKLVNFSIEETSQELKEWLDPSPAWMAAYRGGPRISETERKKRIRQIVRDQDPHDSPARTNLETSKRMLSL